MDRAVSEIATIIITTTIFADLRVERKPAINNNNNNNNNNHNRYIVNSHCQLETWRNSG
jgi:hypothetical protein